MDYESCIQRTLNYIEEHLSEPITLETLSEIACFSPFHYHRIFQVMVGDSVMDYVRKRRLTSAAERLFYSNDKIITIAIDSGFQYQESFNRAFKKMYGVSPKQYRNLERISGPFHGKTYLISKQFLGGCKMEPVLRTKPAFHIIGYALKTKNTDGQNNRDIPEFWQQYIQNKLGCTIPNPVNNADFGICTDFCPETGEFVYIIGMEVEEGTKALEGMVYRQFHEQEYAVFTTPEADTESFTTSIQSTWNYIFTEWFQQSDYEHSGTVEFELYDERCGGPEKVMDIYIPVKKRAIEV